MFASRTVCGIYIPCVALYILSIFFIVMYGYYLRKSKTQDVLAKELYNHPICQNIDGWSISHLLFFGLLGVLFPGMHLQFLLIGIGWEVIETTLGQNELTVSGNRVQLIGDQDKDGNLTGDETAYWYGKESDIVMDILGYCIGSAWATKYWPNDKLPTRQITTCDD